MDTDHFSEKTWPLFFGVQRSVRYHDRRLRFYELLHKQTTAFSLVLGSATIAGILGSFPGGKQTALICAGIVTVLSAFDLIMGFSAKAGLHANLRRRFIQLESDMIAAPNDDQMTTHTMARLTIESDEPPAMRVLDSLCHNELIRAHGIDKSELVKVSFIQRMTANLLAWP